MAEYKTDVFISGAGPVGLILAYQLNRLGISTFIIDAANKASPRFPMYGRACSLQPGSLELLDRLDLLDDIAQESLVARRTFTYQNGKRLHGGGFGMLERVYDTFFDYCLNLRLKYIEDILREKLTELGSKVHAPLKLVDFTLDEDDTAGDHRVTAKCSSHTGELITVKARYIVGADGGSSTVRKLAKIPFPGDHRDQHWVRIDGVVKTNIPEARIGFGALESKTHGQVLFAALDHGATRIGYALSTELFEKYGMSMTQEQAVREAQNAVAPFECEFEQVDWYTVYGIQQRVAERFVDRGRILLAGDAAHTHSSGAAQGLNTGIHDVCNLYWKLSGVMKGYLKPEVLENYSEERRATAQQLIEYDKTISRVVSAGRHSQSEKDKVAVRDFFEKVSGFTHGVGITYPENLLNDTKSCLEYIRIRPGHRGQDVLVQKPNLRQNTIRLFEVTKFNGKFRVLVFAGQPKFTIMSLKQLRIQVDRDEQRFAHAVEFVTIVEGFANALDEHLGVRKFGKAYYDCDSSAHHKYGAVETLGALVVLRPDGIVGISAPLNGFEEVVVPYLERIMIPQEASKTLSVNGSEEIGELMNPFENNLGDARQDREIVV